MIINFYRITFCPRCKKAEHILQQLMPEFPQLELNTIELVTHPLKTFQAGIRMIPALECSADILSGVLLKEEQIHKFLECQNNKLQKPA